MTYLMEPAKKIGEIILVYLATAVHFVAQPSGIEKLDYAVSIAVGISVFIFTIIRIYDWWEKRKERLRDNEKN